MNPWSLNYWQSGEYQVVREKLDDEEIAGHRINPVRKDLFRSLSLTAEKAVKVCIIGQDPYPQHRFATGVAFSIPVEVPVREFPPTLKVFLREYQDDLGYTMPSHGNLEQWSKDGVLLWNATPSCREGASLSHDWSGSEWSYLTREIISRLSARGIVFAFLGSVAKRYVDCVDQSMNSVICTSHPSPRGSLNSKTPFIGSRLFSTINARLVELGMSPVDWRLDGSASTNNLSRAVVDRGNLLPNITGATLPGLKGKTGPNRAASTFEV